MSTKTTFQRVKSFVNNDEATALQQVCLKEGFKPEQLVSDHTEKMFRWNLITPDSKDLETTFETYSVDEFTEAEAIEQAKADLNTFEGNLKTNHNETHFRFAKVRA